MKLASTICAFSLIAIVTVFGDGLSIGSTAPPFRVVSGDDRVLTDEMVVGKLVFILYESVSAIEKNRELIMTLRALYADQTPQVQEKIVRLSVINCSGAFWPFTDIWKKKLRESSAVEGLTIYGDWSGKMAEDYRMKSNESNVVLVDTKGVIRYFSWGKIGKDGISEIISLMKIMWAEN